LTQLGASAEIGNGVVEIALGNGLHGLGEARNGPGNGARDEEGGEAQHQHGKGHNAREHKHGLIEHGLDRGAGDGDHEGADDGTVFPSDGLVADEIGLAGDVAVFRRGSVGEKARMKGRAGDDRQLGHALTGLVDDAGGADEKVRGLLGVEDIDGNVLAGDAGNGIDHVSAAEARHAAARQRRDIAGFIDGDV
jgi:hypothetical protein